MAQATITLADSAPAEKVHFTFGYVEFGLVGQQKYETDDPQLMSDAEAHSWLTVKYAPKDIVQGSYREQLAPKDDHLSALGSSARPNDPAEALAAEKAKHGDKVALDLAVEVSDDQQSIVIEDGIVAKTLAADPTTKTSSNVKGKN